MEQGVTEKGHFREAKCKDSGGSYKVGTNLLYNDTILCNYFLFLHDPIMNCFKKTSFSLSSP